MDQVNSSGMVRGMYLVPNLENYKKKERQAESGASSHIAIGIKHLSAHFNIEAYVLNNIDVKEKKNHSELDSKTAAVGKKVDRNKAKGFLRDIKYLIKNHVHFYRYYRNIKKANPSFIYERSEYLNLNGIFIARILGVPHFYESNWVHHLGMRQFYLSYFNKMVKIIEEWVYNHSSHSFFIGNQNKYLSLKEGRWSIVQNGVGANIIERFSEHENNIQNDQINFCILANLMPHHRFEILIEALNLLDDRRKHQITIHLIGFNFEHVLDSIPKGIRYVNHGPKTKEEIYPLLCKMNVAIISGGPHYSSFMKLYDYAAVKLAVICPELENVVANFTQDEILFFKNEDGASLADKLRDIVDNPDNIQRYGNALYDKVKNNFTWEIIFSNISKKIVQYI